MSSAKEEFPLVSFITVNYNQSNVTLDLLRTLKTISYPNYEIIVVDNASPNDHPEILKDQYPEIDLILSDKNLGFAGGNNLGIKAAKGEYFFFINNDTEVPPNLVEPIIELFYSDNQIGMISPKIKFHWNPELIQYAGFTKMNPYTIRNNSIGYHQKDTDEFNHIQETNACHGAAMVVPRKVIKDVGMMTEVYFLYYEEHDWSEHIKKGGYKIYYQPRSYILHKESVSTGKNSPFQTYYLTRNRLIFSRRNFKGATKIISILFQILISWPKNTIVYLAKGQFDHLWAYSKGVLWNFNHFKAIHQSIKL